MKDFSGEKKVLIMGHQKEKDKAERVPGLGRRTREDTWKVDKWQPSYSQQADDIGHHRPLFKVCVWVYHINAQWVTVLTSGGGMTQNASYDDSALLLRRSYGAAHNTFIIWSLFRKYSKLQTTTTKQTHTHTHTHTLFMPFSQLYF